MNTVLKFKDGDEGGAALGCYITIEAVDNGYIVTREYDDGESVKEVYISKDKLLKELGESL